MLAFETDVPFMDETFAEDLNAKVTEDFKTAFNAERCPGLKFNFDEKIITFKLIALGLTAEKITAFRDLAALINGKAKKLKRTSFKKAQDDNPKYALRTWLMRLGMKGEEYKKTRKVLLKNIEGSGAFR